MNRCKTKVLIKCEIYLHNSKNNAASFYKKGAISYIKTLLENKYPSEKKSWEAAEEALQLMLFNNTDNIPFPSPKKRKFTFNFFKVRSSDEKPLMYLSIDKDTLSFRLHKENNKNQP